MTDKKTFDSTILEQIDDDLTVIEDYDRPFIEDDKPYDRLTDRAVEWIHQHPELIPTSDITH